MKILYLGPDNRLVEWLRLGNEVMRTEEPLAPTAFQTVKPDFVVSYGYRHILKFPLIGSPASPKAVNLHIGYLPYNRGADPNIWSIIDGTPKGVTIHEIDSGIDTGRIITQRLVDINDSMTLKEAYELLKTSIESLFMNHWELIKSGKYMSYRQGPTSHTTKDRNKFAYAMGEGWDTKISDFKNKLCEDIFPWDL